MICIWQAYVGEDRLWGGAKRPAHIISMMSKQKHPAGGGRFLYRNVLGHVQRILNRCWHYTPSERPLVRDILKRYRKGCPVEYE